MKVKRLFIILWVVVLSLSASAQWNTSSMLRMGQNAIYFDDYVSAIENFNHIIQVKPYLSEPYFFRGLAKLNLDDYEGAIQDFSQAIVLNPNYFHAYMYRGIANHRVKKFREALSDYAEAIELDPTAAYVYANRGVTEAELGDYAAAERDYSKALQIDGQLLSAYLNRAIVRGQLNDVEGAMSDCNAVIRLNMFSDDAFGLRGYLYYQQKDYHSALEDFNRALRVDPDNKRILMSRAMVWYEMKKFPETLADYDRALQIDSNYVYAYYNRAMLRSEIGETNAAIRDLDKVLELNPDNILIYFNRGLLKMEIRDWYGAYDDFSESIRIYPDFVKAYLVRAVTREKLNEEQEADKDRYMAMQIMERYKKMKAGDRNALVDTTANFQKLIDIHVRQDELRDVINGRVQDKKVIVELQNLFCVQYVSLDSLRNGKVQYYNKHIMNYNQEHDYNPAVTICNVFPYYPKEFVTAFMAELSENINRNQDVNSYWLRGCFYMKLQEYTKAIADFSVVLQKEPNHLLALFNRANAQMLMYDYIESVEDHTSKRVGGNQEEYRKIDFSLVLEGYEQCLKLDPDFVYAWYNMANVYAKNREINKAIEVYTQVIQKDKELAEAYFNRGLLYIYIGQKALANADLSKAGELGIVEAYNIIKRYCKEID